MARGPTRRFDWWEFLLLCGIFLAVAFLWNTVWIYPLKLFVVLLHEVSHGLCAILTGGRIEEIRVFQEEGGVTVTTGGNAFLITSAGYLGSMFWGVMILLVSTRTKLSNWLVMLLGIGAVALALFRMPREGRWFTAGCGIVLASLGPLPRVVPEFVLRVIGVTSCLYAILDIKSDVLDRPNAASDATALAKMTHVPSLLWGALWIAIALVVTFLAAKHAVTGGRADAEVQSRSR